METPLVVPEVVAALVRSGAGVRLVPRPPGAFRCDDVARLAGMPLGAVAKTVVVRMAGPRFVLAVVPGNRRVSLAKVAALAGGGAAALASATEAARVTGHAIGGITPLACRSGALPVFVDATLGAAGIVNVGSGHPDVGLELSVRTVLELANAVVADLADDRSP